MLEIERKFLVISTQLPDLDSWENHEIQQGYLMVEPDKSLRIRIKGKKGFLTIKLGSNALIREEFEYEIPVEDARSLLTKCGATLHKMRYDLIFEGKHWEVDVFKGNLEGLILAEIELSDVGELFINPPWLGKEVTEDPKYLNVNLIKV